MKCAAMALMLLCVAAVVAIADDKVVSTATVSTTTPSLEQQIDEKVDAILKAKTIYDLEPSLSNGEKLLTAMDDYIALLEKINRELTPLVELLEEWNGKQPKSYPKEGMKKRRKQ